LAIVARVVLAATALGAAGIEIGRVVLITPAALQQMLALGLAQPIDMRSVAAFRAGHVPGALHVTLDRIEDAAREIRSAAGRRTLVPYCAGADDDIGREGARRLRALGFPDVSVLAGGFAAWIASGGPIASTASVDHLSAAASVARNFLNVSSVSTMSWPRIR